jgi:cyclic lactone autoinducer peptide
MKKAILSVVSVVAVLFATLVASSACIWFLYQPNEPESLQNR